MFLGLVRLFFFFFCLFGFEVLQSVRACLVGVLHYFFEFLFPCLALHISMGPGCSSVLHIGSNSTEASGSGRYMVNPTVWPWWFTRLPEENLLSPWVRAREKLVKSDILAALNI